MLKYLFTAKEDECKISNSKYDCLSDKYISSSWESGERQRAHGNPKGRREW